MLCSKCGKDTHPTIELGQASAANALGIGARSGAVYVCGNGACHADLGPVKPHAEPVRAVAVPTEPTGVAVSAMEMAADVRPAPATRHVAPVASGSHIDRMRARLAELAPLAEEFELLQRALRAVDRGTRKPRKSNVVSLKASAQ